MPAAHAYHDQAGDVFAAHAADGPHNAYTDRPAMLTLAGDVAGLRILDAGCGGGHYAAELVGRGADVVAVDGSATPPPPLTTLTPIANQKDPTIRATARSITSVSRPEINGVRAATPTGQIAWGGKSGPCRRSRWLARSSGTGPLVAGRADRRR